ncbi:MAG: DUF4340 domain-containing protein [Kastovskya adunca ATA6-11-RM4]|jgi:hypothetical protein|nr:DUF4340 domain-containing protein [Kastovskya adunca ATA6-11-RM4]
MKLQRTTLVLLVSAVFLGGFVYFYETQEATQREVAQAKEGTIFSFKEEDIQAFTLKTEAETLAFERVSDGEFGWRMKKPKDAPASGAAVSYLLNLFEGKSDRTLTVPAKNRAEYGLKNPQATIEVKLKNQQTHKFLLGKPNFDQSSLYALTDPPNQTSQQLEVMLVSSNFENAVNRPLSEWERKDDVIDGKTSDSTEKPVAEGKPSDSTEKPAAKTEDTSNKPAAEPKPSDSTEKPAAKTEDTSNKPAAEEKPSDSTKKPAAKTEDTSNKPAAEEKPSDSTKKPAAKTEDTSNKPAAENQE